MPTLPAFSYQDFGPRVNHDTREVCFRLFFPDNTKDILQFGRGGLPKIKEISIPGTYLSTGWDEKQAPKMVLKEHASGLLYEHTTTLASDGFYQYKFYVVFEDQHVKPRWVNDPCTRYGARLNGSDNSGFVVGGSRIGSEPLHPVSKPIPPDELIIYEMMVDDFTEKLPASNSGQHNKLDVVRENIGHLKQLGFSALQLMPWTAVPGEGFNWGYEPFLFFSVDDRLTNRKDGSPVDNLNRLFSLKQLIDASHHQGLHVIMDGVFNHAREEFPYLLLYQNREDCPFIGNFAEAGFFEEFDFDNSCTRQFIFDVCRYWIDTYGIDGIRFDYVKGFYRRAGGDPGITTLIGCLRRYLKETGRPNFSLILENLPDNRYQAVAEANQIGATGTWYDPLMFEAFDAGRNRRLQPSLMRALNSGKDFAADKAPVSYIQNHDHGSLVNKIGGDRVGVDRWAHWYRTQPFAIALLTTPGTIMIHNGQEFGDEYFIPESGSDRVSSRPLNWQYADDKAGKALQTLYTKLIQIRNDHPALSSKNFYPDSYDYSQTKFNQAGYGVDVERQIVIYHRWGKGLDQATERFIIALNFTDAKQFVDLPFPLNGSWLDLLSGDSIQVNDFIRKQQDIDSHYGRIFYRKD
jgi:1,4-alpha-glucan branching enzyme